MATSTLKSVSYNHDAMIDLIIQDPTVTTNELAEIFGYSPGWVSRVLAADSFQARLAQRKSALIDPIIARSLNERMRSVAIRSMDIIEEKLATEPSAQYAMDALELATMGLGVVSAAVK
jgi:DeoR/GlpR family transcriptional regulator of sugar metabolism